MSSWSSFVSQGQFTYLLANTGPNRSGVCSAHFIHSYNAQDIMQRQWLTVRLSIDQATCVVLDMHAGGKAFVKHLWNCPLSCRLVPLDKLDLRLVQVMYLNGDIAAIRAWDGSMFGGANPMDAISIVASPAVADVVWREVCGRGGGAFMGSVSLSWRHLLGQHQHANCYHNRQPCLAA